MHKTRTNKTLITIIILNLPKQQVPKPENVKD